MDFSFPSTVDPTGGTPLSADGIANAVLASPEAAARVGVAPKSFNVTWGSAPTAGGPRSFDVTWGPNDQRTAQQTLNDAYTGWSPFVGSTTNPQQQSLAAATAAGQQRRMQLALSSILRGMPMPTSSPSAASFAAPPALPNSANPNNLAALQALIRLLMGSSQ